MYGDVLVPVDDREPSTVALEYALDLAAEFGGRVHLLYVADTNKPSQVQYGGDVVDVLERTGEEVLADARERAADSAVPVDDDIVQGDPRAEILAACDGVDLVVMGTHGRSGLDGYLLGSVTEHVVRESDTPVLAVRAELPTPPPRYEGILVPTDGSDHARAALGRAADIAARYDVPVHLLSVVEEPTFGGLVGSDAAEREAEARGLLDETAAAVDYDDVVTAVESGSVPDAIRKYAEDSPVDLLVMGTHGRRGIDERLLGSTTERVLRTAPIPVLTTTDTATGE